MHTSIVKRITLVTASMALGYASWVLPLVLVAGSVQVEIPPLISVSTNPEVTKFVWPICLFATGLLTGFFAEGYGWAVLIGSATGFPIVVFAVAEMVFGLASHNLWPIEFAMYAVFTIPAILGSLLGVFVREQKRGQAGY